MPRKTTRSPTTERTACYLGSKDPFGLLVEQALVEAGYRLVAPDTAPSCRLVVDNFSRSTTHLRAAVSALNGTIGQYVLVSSHQVYSSSAHLRPWREEDADTTLDLSASLSPATLAARSVERTLRLLAHDRFPFTILRPALLEGDDTRDVDVTRWLTDRVVNGGVVVLPEGDLPSYRHLSPNDLVRAILAVAETSATHGQVLNVANQATLSYWGHAAMVRDGLNLPLRFGYLPLSRWRAANLMMPLGELGSSTFIEPSPLLHTLGWRADNPLELVTTRARQCAQQRRPYDQNRITRERRALEESEAEVPHLYQPARSSFPLPRHTTRQWSLRGWAGQPASLTLERMAQVQTFPAPVVKVRALTLSAPEERFLRGEYLQYGHRAIGHNALLEVLNPGLHPLPVGMLAIPVSMLPCGDSDCPFCRGGAHAVLGIAVDGYGWGICSTPPSHLLPVPASIGMVALLADPLGTLIASLSEPLARDTGPVWIAGRTVDAALVAWLAQDAGRPVVHVDRRSWDHPEFPVQAVETVLDQCRSGERAAPTLAVDLTGAVDVSWPLTQALALTTHGNLFVRRRPPGIADGVHWHELPAVAPNRTVLNEALLRLQRWVPFRNLDARVGPAIPLDLYWDALLPSPFSLPYLEADQ